MASPQPVAALVPAPPSPLPHLDDAPDASSQVATFFMAALHSLAAATRGQDLPGPLLRLLAPNRAHLQLLHPLGHGGYGRVYLAYNRLEQRTTAVKRIRFNSSVLPWAPAPALEEDHERVLREVRALATLGPHPNVVRYHTAWLEPDWGLLAARQDLLTHASASPVPPRSPVAANVHVVDHGDGYVGDGWGGGRGPCSDTLSRRDTLHSANSIDSTPWSERDSLMLRRQSWLAARPSTPLTRLLSGSLSDCSQSDSETHTQPHTNARLGPAVLVEEPTDESAEGGPRRAGELVPYAPERLDVDNTQEGSGSGQDTDQAVRFNPRQPVPYVLYISMEYVDGIALDVWLRERNTRRVVGGAAELSILRDIVSGLDHVHAQGLMHRDLKPANVFVARPPPGEPSGLPRAKLGDFGLAVQEARDEAQRAGHAASSGSLATAPSSGSGRHTSDVGTVTYQAPEQRTPDGEYGCAVDVFALGLIVMELFTCFDTMSERAFAFSAARRGILPEDMELRFPVLSTLALELLSPEPSSRPSVRALREHPLLGPSLPGPPTRLDRALGAPCAATAQLADARRVISAQEGEIDLLKRQLQAAQEELSRLQVASEDDGQ